MARIEVNSNDLDLLYDEMQNAISKVEDFTSYLAPGFNLTKKDSLYNNGFKKIIEYEENLKDNIKISQKSVKDFRDELDNIERVYTEKFESMGKPLTEIQQPTLSGEETVPVEPTFDDEEIIPIGEEIEIIGDEDEQLTNTPMIDDFDDLETVPLYDISNESDGEVHVDDEFMDVPSDVEEVPLYNINTSSYPSGDIEYGPSLDEDLGEDTIAVEEEPQEDELTRLMRETEEANNMSVTEAVNYGATDTMSSLIGGEM